MTQQEQRAAILQLVISVLRKADISARHVLGAARQGGHWWIEFKTGWIKTSHLLTHTTQFKTQHKNII